MHSVFSRLLRKFPESAHTLRRTQTLTTVGLFLAIQMVLSSYGTIQVNDSLKISLAHLALAPTAMLFGPVAAALQGAMSDILGFLLKPTGPYFPGFTISAALGGVIYGLFLFESDRKLWQIVLARAVIMVLVNIMLNTLFLTMLYGPSQAALLPVRALKNAMQFPIDCLLLTAVCRTVQRIPTPAGLREVQEILSRRSAVIRHFAKNVRFETLLIQSMLKTGLFTDSDEKPRL
ncbi:MAG: folate family ECF transporter S component [Christensenellales bacterium]